MSGEEDYDEYVDTLRLSLLLSVQVSQPPPPATYVSLTKAVHTIVHMPLENNLQ